ncbi:MAG: alpha-glucuronidase family glycosyl hydrolase [Balneolaceae bacterium]
MPSRKIFREITLSGIIFLMFFSLQTEWAGAEDGHRMWLRYDLVSDPVQLHQYRNLFRDVVAHGSSPTFEVLLEELELGMKGLLGESVRYRASVERPGTLLIGTPDSSDLISSLGLEMKLRELGPEGFLIEQMDVGGVNSTVIAANRDIGLLYGVFELFRRMQTEQDLVGISHQAVPRVQHRVVNHWDNLDRTVERGYAGISLWEWGTLPEYHHPRYREYARFNASIGVNATAINNVNANPLILTDHYLEKVKVLADIFRPYGIRMFLSVNFDSPRRIGGLDTSDPLDPDVRAWWKEQVENVYSYIPDFGGFLVKADSEGQPGPHGYGRDHADGANMLAEALEPYGGIVFWRAFVYDPEQSDRIREAYDEFVPLDGKFMENVILQVKNGPLDFQPREPFSPLFGALPQTNTMIELQVTQEYFGFANHLAYQGPLFEEVLQAETYARGEGSTVARIIDGDLFEYSQTGMAAVINPGTERNWTGHPFVQSSWYAFGRLAWDHSLTAEEIADEWIRMTFTNDVRFVEPVKEMMLISREAGVNYRSPLGLTHLYAQGHHYGPAPWNAQHGSRPDWTAVYYHRADEEGIGFDRTETGSNAVEQYHSPLSEIFGDPNRVPEELLLWFHRVDWDHEMSSGRTLWEELVYKYYEGVEMVRQMQDSWNHLEGLIDEQRFDHVKALLTVQEKDAIRWRDSCVLYFQTFSGMPIPEVYELPKHSLERYIELEQELYIPRF